MLEGKKMRRVFFLHIILVVIGFNLNLLLKLSLYPPITTYYNNLPRRIFCGHNIFLFYKRIIKFWKIEKRILK